MRDLMSLSNRQEIAGLPVNPDVLFADHKNIYKKSIEKRQRKLLSKIGFIKPFLNENETILCITTGCSPMSLFEQFLTGWIVFYLKRSLFVFTNERIFHIPTKHDFKYRGSIARILYADCRKFAVKGRTLIVEYNNSGKEKFLYIPRSESKKIKSLLETASLDARTSSEAGRTHLCPRCTIPLLKDRYTCPGCSLEFKNKQKARKISIIFPGGGYFYTGHPLLGIGDALAEAYLTFFIIAALVATVSGVVEAVGAFVFVFVILILEKLMTIYHSNHFIKEYIPASRFMETSPATPAAQQPDQTPTEPKPEEILSASYNGKKNSWNRQ